MKDIILACEEHLDEAMDEFVEKNETFPILERVNGGVCSFCEKEAEYSLKEISSSQ